MKKIIAGALALFLILTVQAPSVHAVIIEEGQTYTEGMILRTQASTHGAGTKNWQCEFWYPVDFQYVIRVYNGDTLLHTSSVITYGTSSGTGYTNLGSWVNPVSGPIVYEMEVLAGSHQYRSSTVPCIWVNTIYNNRFVSYEMLTVSETVQILDGDTWRDTVQQVNEATKPWLTTNKPDNIVIKVLGADVCYVRDVQLNKVLYSGIVPAGGEIIISKNDINWRHEIGIEVFGGVTAEYIGPIHPDHIWCFGVRHVTYAPYGIFTLPLDNFNTFTKVLRVSGTVVNVEDYTPTVRYYNANTQEMMEFVVSADMTGSFQLSVSLPSYGTYGLALFAKTLNGTEIELHRIEGSYLYTDVPDPEEPSMDLSLTGALAWLKETLKGLSTFAAMMKIFYQFLPPVVGNTLAVLVITLGFVIAVKLIRG